MVIRESDPASMEASIVRAREAGGFLEFRLDYLKPEDLSASNVTKWVELAQRPVVLTLRRRANGGEFDGSEEAQVRDSQIASRSISSTWRSKRSRAFSGEVWLP